MAAPVMEREAEAEKPDLVTRQEAADLLRVSPGTVINYERRELIAPLLLPTGRKVLYRREEVEGLLRPRVAPRRA